MIKPNPETRNVIVEVYVDVPFGATLRDIEDDVESTLNRESGFHVTDIEAKENVGEYDPSEDDE